VKNLLIYIFLSIYIVEARRRAFAFSDSLPPGPSFSFYTISRQNLVEERL
jgi:hypothetical protein